MHFSSDIWWSSVHIRHSHARWGTSCSLCHKHTGNLVSIRTHSHMFFYQLIYLIHDEIDSICYCSGDDEFLERVLITKSSRYKEGHVHAITLPCSCDNWICIFFSCWIFQGNCKIDSYDASEALVIKELLLFFIMIKQHTFFIVLFTLHCEAWFLDSDNRHSLLWKAFYLLILFPTISHIIS